METLERFITEHPFLTGLSAEYTKLLVGCAKNVRFEAGVYIVQEGQQANEFFLIRHGRVALQISAPPRKATVVETLGEGEILGWSWLLPPYQWKVQARTVEPTRAIALDGKCLRSKCEDNHDLGYELLKRFAKIIERRLEAAQLQVIDIYAAK